MSQRRISITRAVLPSSVPRDPGANQTVSLVLPHNPMSSPRYRPILPVSALDAEREMEEAFESDNEDGVHSDHESTPLTTRAAYQGATTASSNYAPVQSIPGGYDFEREYEYDYPPPGSPPRPSARALPNDIGNSNGVLPTSPVRPTLPKLSLFRRVAGAIMPTQYAPIPTLDFGSTRPIGGGTENDGVFANVMAKPQAARVVRTENGEVHMVPEDNQKETPPTYAEAQADAVPPYWETTVHAPAGIESGADMIVDDLPTGSFAIFCLNAFISFFFQFVGFLLTYLLHTSHAAKYGSRAGLGFTLIQFGLYSRSLATGDSAEPEPVRGWPPGFFDNSTMPMSPDPSPSPAPTPDDVILPVSSRDWLSFFFMTLGWFLVLSSLIGFWRIKRWESALRAPPVQHTVEDIERDREIRRNIENVFGIAFGDNDDEERRDNGISEAAAEARLTRDLRAAGLL